MCLALQRPQREPSGKLIRSIGGHFGRSWIGKSLPGSEFSWKSWAYFNDFIFRPERFLEGLERVLGVCSRAKEGPKGGPGKFFKFTLGPKGGSQSEKGSLIQSGPNGAELGREVAGSLGSLGKNKGQRFHREQSMDRI